MNKAEKRAREVLSKHHVKSPPVPVEAILTSFGIRILLKPYDAEQDFNDVSGMLYRTGSETIVGINASHSVTRQRFTLAHELGHFLLHKGDLFVDAKVNFRNKRSELGIHIEEVEANAFAAALLMPAEMLTLDFYEVLSKDSEQSPVKLVASLAAKYQVSEIAMEFRLKNIGLLQVE